MAHSLRKLLIFLVFFIGGVYIFWLFLVWSHEQFEKRIWAFEPQVIFYGCLKYCCPDFCFLNFCQMMHLHKKEQTIRWSYFLVSRVRCLDFAYSLIFQVCLGITFKNTHIMLQHGYLGGHNAPPPSYTEKRSPCRIRLKIQIIKILYND